MEQVRIFLTTTGAGTWTVPEDWNNLNNTIEVIGGGATADMRWQNVGGGAYSSIANKSLTPGASVSYSVGIAGPTARSDGGDTWFGNSVYASSYVAAKGGNKNTAGGAAVDGIGTVKYSGGAGSYNGGGGGAAGPYGNGNTSANNSYLGGSGGAGYGGAGGSSWGGTGGDGTEWDSTHGSGGGGAQAPGGIEVGYAGKYGGGGGHGVNGFGTGAQGIIVITYTPVAPGSSNFFQLFN